MSQYEIYQKLYETVQKLEKEVKTKRKKTARSRSYHVKRYGRNRIINRKY
jgi:hypothetical protein